MGLLSREQIDAMGFGSVGDNVLLSDKASFYNCANIHIGNNVRIDDFCVLSAGADGIYIGNYIHIAIYSSLQGAGMISLSDYCNISSRVAIYSSSDDYSGAFMTNPMVPCEYTNVYGADVSLGKHVIIGANSVVLPGVTIGEGVAVGSLSLIKDDCEAFGIYAGNPAKYVKPRKQDLLELEKQFSNSL